MARKYDITRTIEATTVNCLCFNKNTAEAENVVVIVTGKYNDPTDRKLEKQIIKNWNDNDRKFIDIVDVHDSSKCYGCTTEQFLAIAKEIDPKTRQPITNEDF